MTDIPLPLVVALVVIFFPFILALTIMALMVAAYVVWFPLAAWVNLVCVLTGKDVPEFFEFPEDYD